MRPGLDSRSFLYLKRPAASQIPVISSCTFLVQQHINMDISQTKLTTSSGFSECLDKFRPGAMAALRNVRFPLILSLIEEVVLKKSKK